MIKKENIKGTLIPIGGNEDKGANTSEMHTLDFVTDGILSHVVKESGGLDALIVVIPTASSIPNEVGENYVNAFEKLGCTNIKVLKLTKREQAGDPKFLEWIKKANCVMFSGGDQSKIVDKIGGTKMHEILRQRYLHEDFVIAGTSAGAMAMSTEMIAGGTGRDAFSKGSVEMRDGMGFFPEHIIDSHFILRGRFGRLAEAVATFPNLIGVGLAEDTAIVIKQCNRFKIIGSGMVIIFDGSELTHNAREFLDEGTPMSMSNLKVHVLSNSDIFYVDERRVEVLPIHAPFE